MNRPGKVENIVSEAAAMQLDVCGLSETHWTQSGEMTIGEHMVITSSDQNRNYQGVGLIISKNLRKSVMSYNAVSSRIITIRIKARPANMSIIQIYAPTLDKDDDVHDEFYEQLQATMESIKRSDYLIVLGDFNAILGNEKVPCVTGSHGTGIRNNSGQRLLEFCSANDLFVTNTGFRHHLRRKTTWISPDGRTKNEIDYILIRSRFKSSALNCRAYPKADCGSDHNLVAARLRLRFTAKKAITTTRKVRWNVDKLQEEAQHEAYNEELAHVLRNTQSDSTIDNQWETIKTTITIAAKATIGKREMTAKQKWITPRTLELMEERKQLKPLITRSQEDKERYSLKDKEVRHACEEDKKDYLEGICLHLQDCKHPSQAGIAYKYIRGLKKPFTLRSRTIKDAQDRPIDDTDEIRERWRGYTESLYTKVVYLHLQYRVYLWFVIII